MKNILVAVLTALFLFVSVGSFADNAPKKTKTTCTKSACGTSCKSAATVAKPANTVKKVAKADGECCPTSADCVCIPTGSSCVCVPATASVKAAPVLVAQKESKANCPNRPGCICE